MDVALDCISECKRAKCDVDVTLAQVFGSYLKLQDIKIVERPAQAAPLAEAIAVNTTLTQLSLWDNNIDDAGAASLAEAFKVNATLTQLSLWGNNIGDAGAASLAEAIKVNS